MKLEMESRTLILLFIIGTQAVDLHFQNPDSGFFLRPEEHHTHTPSSMGVEGGVLDVERFTVLDPTRPALIRATYGPFSTKQTVPARYVLPEFPDEVNGTKQESEDTGESGHLPPVPHQLEVSAHLVNKIVSRAQPTLRVLIHGAGARGHHSPHVCVTVITRHNSDALSASCTPTGAGETGGDATCLITLAIPSRWWPLHTRATVKIPRVAVKVSYLVGTAPGPSECASRDSGSPFQAGPRVTVQPETDVGEVVLSLDTHGYDELTSDSLVHVLVPRAPLHPGTTIHAPLYLHPPGNLPALVLVLRCRAKGGIRVAGVEASSSAWNLTVEVNSKRSLASVTAILADPPDNNTLHNLGLHEVLSWVLEVPDHVGAGEAKVSWSLRYVMDAHKRETYTTGTDSRKMVAKLTILKDDIQAVLPIAKSWSIVNTAVLTGRQVSRAMKVLIVSQAGKVADVTLQSSCNCTDEAALKVSTSCTSVYLDGSEVRGSHNATVVARYDILTGAAFFTIWMPALPLTVHVDDTKLSQIRGWRSPDIGTPSFGSKFLEGHVGGGGGGANAVTPPCSVRYQQTPVEVYGRFVAVDDNSGRQSYLLSRRAQVRVTELVAHLLRVGDTSVAVLDHTTLIGRSPGRTEIQVLSPITGRVIGAREVKVGSDKVWVSRLRAAVISGLTLSLQPDTHLPDGYSAITAVTPTLTAKYQEGLVDVWVEMSDGVVTPLREVPPQHYTLRIRSLDGEIVAVAPSPRTSQPRVIAIGHGAGDLLEVSLEVSDKCEQRRASLATTKVHVKIDLGTTPPPPPPSENHLQSPLPPDDLPDGHKLKIHVSELPHADAAAPHQMLMAEEPPQPPPAHSRLHPHHGGRLAPLEIGMYVLLAVFGAAIIIFAASYVVYSWGVRGSGIGLGGKSRPQPAPLTSLLPPPQESVTNARDWVWLGRATLERASGCIGLGPSHANPQPPANCRSSGGYLMSDLNGNTPPNLSMQPQTSLKPRNSNRFSTTANSQINITNNPGHDLSPQGGTVTPQSSLLTPQATANSKPMSLSGGTTFTRPPRNLRRVTFDSNGDGPAGDVDTGTDEERPPVPPHRHIGVTTHPGNRTEPPSPPPPPVPPHGVNLIPNPMSNGVGPEPKFVEVNADDFVRLRGVCRGGRGVVRRATILENPLLSTHFPNTPPLDNISHPPPIQQTIDNLTPTVMNYDQLMDYFSNLKESNA